MDDLLLVQLSSTFHGLISFFICLHYFINLLMTDCSRFDRTVTGLELSLVRVQNYFKRNGKLDEVDVHCKVPTFGKTAYLNNN